MGPLDSMTSEESSLLRSRSQLWNFDGNLESKISWERDDQGFLQQIKYQVMKNHCVAKVIAQKKTTTPKTLNLLRTSLSANCTKKTNRLTGMPVILLVGWQSLPKTHRHVRIPQNTIVSMYGIFTYIYHKNQPNVGKYTINGSMGTKRDLPWII